VYEQISFAQIDLNEDRGKFSTSTPFKGSAAYNAQKELAKLQRAQDQVPIILSQDQWHLAQHWENGYQNNNIWIFGHWTWRMEHQHTGLKSLQAASPQSAIDNGIKLAYFYELLPYKDLLLIESAQPRGISRPPSIFHLHQYDPQQARQWQNEYAQRHPDAGKHHD